MVNVIAFVYSFLSELKDMPNSPFSLLILFTNKYRLYLLPSYPRLTYSLFENWYLSENYHATSTILIPVISIFRLATLT